MTDKAQLLRTLRMLLDREQRHGMCLDCGTQLQDVQALHECAAAESVTDRVAFHVPGFWVDQGNPKGRAKGYAVR